MGEAVKYDFSMVIQMENDKYHMLFQMQNLEFNMHMWVWMWVSAIMLEREPQETKGGSIEEIRTIYPRKQDAS